MKNLTIGVGVALLVGGCMLESDDPTGVDDSELLAANKLAANKLAANKLAANKLAANKLAANSLQTKDLMGTADGREVMSFIVSCALPSGQSITLTDAGGTPYTYGGLIGLAPSWTTSPPTVTQRRWVTACLLARTNLYGVQVNISMRSDWNPLLSTTAAETSGYPKVEGAFYGDLFAATPVLYACGTRGWTAAPTNSFRACAMSPDGVTTDCGFTFTGMCASSSPVVCSDRSSPFDGCAGGGTSYAEVITVNVQ